MSTKKKTKEQDSNKDEKGIVVRLVFADFGTSSKGDGKDSKTSDPQQKEEPIQDVLLSSVARVLYSLELTHDFWMLANTKAYSQYKFSRYFWLGGRVRKNDQLRLIRLKKGSPLEVILAISATALPTLKLFIGSMLSAYNQLDNIKHDSQMKLLQEEKEKEELEMLKIKVETERVKLSEERIKLLNQLDVFVRRIKAREDGDESYKIFTSLQRRFKETGFRVVEIEISNE